MTEPKVLWFDQVHRQHLISTLFHSNWAQLLITIGDFFIRRNSFHCLLRFIADHPKTVIISLNTLTVEFTIKEKKTKSAQGNCLQWNQPNYLIHSIFLELFVELQSDCVQVYTGVLGYSDWWLIFYILYLMSVWLRLATKWGGTSFWCDSKNQGQNVTAGMIW